MSRLSLLKCDPNEISPLGLAFVGDGVYDLIVREELICEANRPVRELNTKKVEIVRCEAQARLAKVIEPYLTEREADIMRRGRNAHTGHVPKNASVADYHMATALETLIGYLYLSDNIERVRELIDIARKEG